MTRKTMAELAENERQAKKTRRGSVNNTRRLDAFKERRGAGNAEWTSCDARLLLAVVDKITGMGGAVTFSLSRDQGAHGLTLLLDDARESLWFNADADLNAALREVIEVLGADD